jgi:hypothetical protein
MAWLSNHKADPPAPLIAEEQGEYWFVLYFVTTASDCTQQACTVCFKFEYPPTSSHPTKGWAAKRKLTGMWGYMLNSLWRFSLLASAMDMSVSQAYFISWGFMLCSSPFKVPYICNGWGKGGEELLAVTNSTLVTGTVLNLNSYSHL